MWKQHSDLVALYTYSTIMQKKYAASARDCEENLEGRVVLQKASHLKQ